MPITPKTHLIKALNSLDSSRPYERLLKNPKTGDFRELFLPENDFRTCSAVNFSTTKKKTFRFCRPGNQPNNVKFRLEFFFTCPSTYKLNIIEKLFWTLNRNIFSQEG